MLICELSFQVPDSDTPGYSLHEVDYYAGVPACNRDVPNHRLSLRKNLTTGNFEVYRRYLRRKVVTKPCFMVISSTDMGLEEVMFAGSFSEAMAYGDSEYRKYHGGKEPDKVCQHEWPNRAVSCKGGQKGMINHTQSSPEAVPCRFYEVV